MSSRTRTALFAALSLFSGATYASFGPGSVQNLVVANKEVSFDGFPRSAVLAGGTFPGPPITANKGDTLLVNVQDQLSDPTFFRSTSIHWHGIFQNKSAWSDGTSFVTQCPIAANNSFLYEFTPSGQAGTFWYHSHLGASWFARRPRTELLTKRFPAMQYCDGLRGPLIIYDPNDPHKNLYDVDNESTIISLADWFHSSTRGALLPLFYTTNTINGKGRFAGGPDADLAVISVTHGTRYRFRLISMSCEPNFIFSIDGHSMTIIEADGVSTQPLTVESIQIFAGQRYSFVLTANQPVNNYWIRSLPNIGTANFTNGVNSAILRYSGAKAVDPTTQQSKCNKPLIETDLHPLVPTPVPGLPHPGGADVTINLNIGADLSQSPPVFSMNGVQYEPPTVPALLQILSGAQQASQLLPTGSYFSLPSNKVIEISIPGSGDPTGPHPFHLHGHTFSVVRSANSSSYNYINPVVRDVVNTGTAGDNMTFRFVTDNAGPWFLHCHIDAHLQLGLAVVLAENVPGIQQETEPSDWNNLCPIFNKLDADQL
uniref:Laccase n=1 Tax=Mycena chlorophos TaxID=658473 RepID=A0ABQ0MA41_MYCCL|nr:laccase [Mycena chlorophos]